MLKKTEGIVLNFIKYGDSSIITRIFTEDLGIQNYIINSVRSAKGNGKTANYQHFTILDLVVYHKDKKAINRISEQKNIYPLKDIPFNIQKIAIALFCTDLIYRCLKENDTQPDFFHFLKKQIIKLDGAESGFSNFPLFIIFKLTETLGILPENLEEVGQHIGQVGLKQELAQVFTEILKYEEFDEFKINQTTRRELTDCMLSYLQKHFETLHNLHSLEVLREVLEK
jgi:DNA repair protein RecO (recombination protein O)